VKNVNCCYIGLPEASIGEAITALEGEGISDTDALIPLAPVLSSPEFLRKDLGIKLGVAGRIVAAISSLSSHASANSGLKKRKLSSKPALPKNDGKVDGALAAPSGAASESLQGDGDAAARLKRTRVSSAVLNSDHRLIGHHQPMVLKSRTDTEGRDCRRKCIICKRNTMGICITCGLSMCIFPRHDQTIGCWRTFHQCDPPAGDIQKCDPDLLC
jgi:hypothetical protein